MFRKFGNYKKNKIKMSNSNCFYAQNSEEKNLTLIHPQMVMETLRLKTILSTNSQEKTVYSKKKKKKQTIRNTAI